MSIPDAASTDENQAEREVLIVDASLPYGQFDIRELWRYRELIWIFADRDIKVRYRQTLVGIAWTVLQPLAQMLAFNGLFQMLDSKPMGGTVPFAVAGFSSLLLYQLFAGILAAATICLVDNRQMVTKVYFPRVILPLSACLRPLLDFCIGMAVLIVMMLLFQVRPGSACFLTPLVILLVVVCGLSLGLWLSALNAHYRDFGYVVPFLIQLGLVASPVLYESNRVPAQWNWLYHINPMAALLDGFRWTLLGTEFPGWTGILISLTAMLCLLCSGAWYFRRVDRFLADSL